LAIDLYAEHSDAPNVPPRGHVLDDSIWESLTGHHARFAERHGRAVRYQPDVAPFVALEDPADEHCWEDAAALVGPTGAVTLFGVATPPDGWKPAFFGHIVQMVDTAVRATPDPEAVVLGPGDVPEILDLIERTDPGPFRQRTIETGTYLGIRRGDRLVAMAGERQHPPGWVELSAVCTDPEFRGQGLASRLILAVSAGIKARGETPFLHTMASNTNAVRLYESQGFTLRLRSVVGSFERFPGF
jgi:ribosomal protein S18 acetylase RimI-like enzyme